MKRLTKNLKHVLSALATADAGEMLTRHGKSRHLAGQGHAATKPATTPHHERASPPRRRQVALWLGDTPADYAVEYALTTCQRMDMDLVVLHPADVDAASRLAPHAGTVAAANLVPEIRPLLGSPVKALTHHLAHTPRIAFVVIGGSDHELHELTDGLAQKRHHHRHPVPMVVVTPPQSEGMASRGKESQAA